MDDHMYEEMMSYAECELVPRFKKEYQEHGTMEACPSCQEMKDLCTALNAVASYAGYSKVTPKRFVEED